MTKTAAADRNAAYAYIQASARAFMAAGAKRLPHIANTMANFRRGVPPEKAVANAKADYRYWGSLVA